MFVRAIFIGLICVFILGCKGDRITGLKVQGGDRPTFVFSGGGWLTKLTVRHTGTSKRPAQGNDVVWEIESEKGVDGAKHVADIGTIQYGVAPAGYRQAHPASGMAPTLLQDHGYMAMAYTIGSSLGRVAFTIQGGKAVAEEASGSH